MPDALGSQVLGPPAIASKPRSHASGTTVNIGLRTLRFILSLGPSTMHACGTNMLMEIPRRLWCLWEFAPLQNFWKGSAVTCCWHSLRHLCALLHAHKEHRTTGPSDSRRNVRTQTQTTLTLATRAKPDAYLSDIGSFPSAAHNASLGAQDPALAAGMTPLTPPG
ncbi:hypothetical protein K466DRAFT_24457 [Polyporus arcularius HHB13444]|uniref:Uncharacterized protein n=1 Tax=Polyporus arcularius HHB13444 TaxID=1314778 RepID=A0A5C3NSH0_9APHY|nr:hypothetical protein K466DRAFT_24457 [Polyporus arcularius HHB13444]